LKKEKRKTELTGSRQRQARGNLQSKGSKTIPKKNRREKGLAPIIRISS